MFPLVKYDNVVFNLYKLANNSPQRSVSEKPKRRKSWWQWTPGVQDVHVRLQRSEQHPTETRMRLCHTKKKEYTWLRRTPQHTFCNRLVGLLLWVSGLFENMTRNTLSNKIVNLQTNENTGTEYTKGITSTFSIGASLLSDKKNQLSEIRLG